MKYLLLVSLTLFVFNPFCFAISCKDTFSKTKWVEKDFMNLLTPELTIPLAEATRKLTEADQIKSPIKITAEMQAFREVVLPLLKIGGPQRESAIRWMEGKLRSQSLLFKKANKGKKTSEYDIVIVGASVHGITAVHEIMRVNPNLKVLFIDKTDTAAANFRKAGATFNINSSNRKSGEGLEPLPGKGNINELPGSPVQVSDITNVKYPTALDLGDALVTSLYGAVSQYKNVDIVFGTTVKSVEYTKGSKFSNTVYLEGNGLVEGFRVSAQSTILGSGLGSPRIPKEIRQLISKDRQLVSTPKGEYKLPRIITFEDILQILQKSSDPKRYFKDKKIAVVGTGDSANVFIEFLLGYATREGYDLSDAQTKGPKKIFWYGQCKSTCEEFISDARSRYAQIGTGYRSSDPATEAIIEAVSGRLDYVEKIPRAGVKAFSGNRSNDVDLIVLTTGYSNRLVDILKKLVAEKVETKDVTTAQFFEMYGEFLEAATSVSGGESVRVARSFADGTVLIIGPSAGKLPLDNELVGIIQNSVSIFNNAPRSQAAAGILASKLDPLANPRSVDAPVNASKLAKNTIEVLEVGQIRLLRDVTEKSLKLDILSSLEFSKTNPKDGIYSFEVTKTSNGLEVSSTNGFPNLNNFSQFLVSNGNFFPALNEVLNVFGKNQYIIEIEFKSGKTSPEGIQLEAL